MHLHVKSSHAFASFKATCLSCAACTCCYPDGLSASEHLPETSGSCSWSLGVRGEGGHYLLVKTLHLLGKGLGFCSCTLQLRTVSCRSGSMGLVTLSRPACGLPAAPTFVRHTTEARVQHKAVKRMTRNRPIKVRLLLCRTPMRECRLWLCIYIATPPFVCQKQLSSGHSRSLPSCVCASCSTASLHESTDHRHTRTLLHRPPCTLLSQRYAVFQAKTPSRLFA